MSEISPLLVTADAFLENEEAPGVAPSPRLTEEVPGVVLPTPAAFDLPDIPKSLSINPIMPSGARMAMLADEICKSVESAKALTKPPAVFSYATFETLPDPNAAAGLIPWPGLPPETLRKMATTMIAPKIVTNTRMEDVTGFSQLSQHTWRKGWAIEMMDAKAQPSEATLRDIKKAEQFISNCNMDIDYANARQRDSLNYSDFQTFLQKITIDAFTYGAMAIWTDMDNMGKVKGFTTLPAGNIRLADERGYKGNPDNFAVLVNEGQQVMSTFDRNQLIWRVQTPRNDPSVGNYGWPSLDQATTIVSAFENALELNADTFCYSEDTEVLTKDGWKLFNKVDIEKDIFATLNLSNGNFEYQKATGKTWVEYSGDMYQFDTRSVDLLVTPNHRIITQYRPNKKKNDYTVLKADDLYKKLQAISPESRNNYCVPTTSNWIGSEIKEKTFDRNPRHYSNNKTKTISGDNYCAFMGMYLSEGSLTRDGGNEKTKVQIHQKSYSKGFIPFKEKLSEILGRESGYHESGVFTFGWRGLAKHLEDHGSSCYTKIIPEEIMNATPKQQKIFWDYYVLGDGSIRSQISKKSGNPLTQEHIATTSKIMADQLQELAQKMGYAATICEIDAKKYTGNIDGREIHATTSRFDIYLKKSKMQSANLKKTYYRGKIGCVTVPNHSLYVRRNGKAAWCGNTKNGIPNGMIVFRGLGFTPRELDLITRLWQNLKKGITKQWALPVMALPPGSEMELIDFSSAKNKDALFQEHLNLTIGIYCCICGLPPKRLGFRISGKVPEAKDNALTKEAAASSFQEEDTGLTDHLMQIENLVNAYLLWTRFPHLRFVFRGKTPREDAREYEVRQLAETYSERRAKVDLKPLEKTAPKELKVLAQLMDLAPCDPGLAGIYQTIASTWLKSELGVESGGEDDGDGGKARFTGAVDGAKKEAHGRISGTRDSSD